VLWLKKDSDGEPLGISSTATLTEPSDALLTRPTSGDAGWPVADGLPLLSRGESSHAIWHVSKFKNVAAFGIAAVHPQLE